MRIYLSSSFQDLEDYRAAVATRLRTLGHEVIQMEQYVAAGGRPADVCVRDVVSCDWYVGIFAWRYGSVPHGWDKSITELEYRAAREKDPDRCLIFLAADGAPWPPNMTDWYRGENDGGARIRLLRDELRRDHVVDTFSNRDQLAAAVIQAVTVNVYGTPGAPHQQQVEKVKRPASAAPRDGYPALWRPGDKIRYRFIDGSDKLRGTVERFVTRWCEFANLKLIASEDEDAEIRISFRYPSAWWLLGPSVLHNTTMNLGALKENSSDQEARRIVLQNFGHALGLRPEHQNPSANIAWNEETIYHALVGPPNYWDRDTIARNMFSAWDAATYPVEKPFDPHSIMAYPLPREWTTDGFEVGINYELSEGDKDFIAKLYPFD